MSATPSDTPTHNADSTPTREVYVVTWSGGFQWSPSLEFATAFFYKELAVWGDSAQFVILVRVEIPDHVKEDGDSVTSYLDYNLDLVESQPFILSARLNGYTDDQ